MEQDKQSRRRGRYANGERTRAALTDAAFALFAEKGFQRLSIRQIADEIGTSHTALLHHFGTKDALLEAVLVRREEHDSEERGQLMRERGLLAAVPEVMRRNAEIPGVIQLDATLQIEAMEPGHVAHDFVKRREAEFVSAVRAELDLEQWRGRLRDGLDLDLVARLIASQIEGIQLAWLADRSVDMAAHLAALMDLLRKPKAESSPSEATMAHPSGAPEHPLPKVLLVGNDALTALRALAPEVLDPKDRDARVPPSLAARGDR